MEYTTLYKSPLGNITLASDGVAITGLWFENQKYFARTLSKETSQKNLSIFNDAKKWLDIYFVGEQPDFDLPLATKGTQFQEDVWKVLLDIPYGTTCTYGDIAKKIAQRHNKKTMSAQAVGGAVGHNPISIIIPCHRVVGANKSLTGYAGGIHLKVSLLELEKININQYKLPTKGTAL
ncbi:methylated-DNA--[protein]-cysteine S-methyltransferase [Anaerorhabdus furcosa]|uniref:Methylated-DNA--protein-cysteine methyltransferase n=1 Tax=Anaerorhabdus furcosa TaxID=118967 RepID=A0A1T4KQ10_9FIRM|nr:methylated-DNA--[protein]-cysteine S-methyltransferase [Anaerorhabdus furcosa]SJZ44490.1 methylated-DNA-[protein]-cysteine S-methyltransferase [Anaerorhabdus furcosa]